MTYCYICNGTMWVEIRRSEWSRTYYQCPVCCFHPPLERPWPWEVTP